MKHQFDIKRDIEIASHDGFFCKGCLTGKPNSDKSPDGRYCNGCYQNNLAEQRLKNQFKVDQEEFNKKYGGKEEEQPKRKRALGIRKSKINKVLERKRL